MTILAGGVVMTVTIRVDDNTGGGVHGGDVDDEGWMTILAVGWW